ncbi:MULTISPECIES: glycosyl-4,4'-diaponeurosporenoate acyltransferase CrtO family protein [unclassified Jeotgalibaca]|uniref:glycosyl-4,4'-diaponeurosporenoate acyltransferase CrtO family protein n=1 Tax=unclassified Jeotgalibaca TaxID=2621505 RepID=UPI003FD5335F
MFVTLPVAWIIILDFVAWFFFHMAISLFFMKVPDDWYARTEKGFRPWEWERNGDFWNSLFGIRNWKRFLPDGSIIVKNAYNKTNLQGTDLDGLRKFIIETKRAELTHWALIPPAFLFFIWNPPWAGSIMVIYALLANIPFIMAQRYNRPRLERLYKLILRRQQRQAVQEKP